MDMITPLVPIQFFQEVSFCCSHLAASPSATKLLNTTLSNCSFLALKIQEKLFMAPLMLGLPLSMIFLWLH